MSDAFSYAVIGKAMEVHRDLGPGVDEIFYHQLLSERLHSAGIEHLFRPRSQLIHRGIVADIFEADLVFPGRMIAELKCLRGTFAPEHFVQIICYQKYWRTSTGLLFDFAKESLVHRRVNYEELPLNGPDTQTLLRDAPQVGCDLKLVRAVCRGVTQVLASHGPGYRDTTYRGLLAAEFQTEGFDCHSQPIAPVRADGLVLGNTQCDCLSIGGQLGVQVLALRHSITAADIAILRTHLRLLDLAHGLILNFGKATLDHCWIRHVPARAAKKSDNRSSI